MLTLPHHFGIEVSLPVHSLQLPLCCEYTWNASKYGSSTLFLKKTRLSKSCSSQNLLSSSNKLTKTLQFHLVLLVEKLDTQPLTKPEKKTYTYRSNQWGHIWNGPFTIHQSTIVLDKSWCSECYVFILCITVGLSLCSVYSNESRPYDSVELWETWANIYMHQIMSSIFA